MQVLIRDDRSDIDRIAAQFVASTINSKPNAVLGLATGSTPLGLYQELVRMHREGILDFSQVTSFNLDEYVGLSRDDPRSYHHFMHENLFRHINIAPQNIYIPSGTTDNYEAFCQWYENRIVECGGIDLQVLGVGSDGHIAFNEPSSSLGSRTRIKTLAKQTIEDNARFFDRAEDVPIYAITMGVGTILEAHKLMLIATGESKADAIAAAIEGPVTSMITASALQLHRDAIVLLDSAAASKLKMVDYYDWIEEKRPGAPSLIPSPHFAGRQRSATEAKQEL
jgi:glucosamine-6-phosphate deaminase